MSKKRDIDQTTGVETTGHEWDGIKELNNPLPRWWVIIFYATIVWAAAYWVFMPAWPGLAGFTKGLRGHSDRTNLERDVADLQAVRAGLGKQLAGASLAEIEANPALHSFAMSAGKSAFANNCATCHGTGAQGAVGYPNLNDDDWLWGGTLGEIRRTLQVGVRSEDVNARRSQMPAFGKDKLLSAAQIDDLVEYVKQLSGSPHDAPAATRAAPQFAANCASCHGADGRGNRSQGAPNLADKIWLYASDEKSIRDQIHNPRSGVMPAWGGRLDSITLDALAIYVHSLGGDE